MNKALSDILGKLNGDMLALQGIESKYPQPTPPPPQTVEQAQISAAQPAPIMTPEKRADYQFTKKLLNEIEKLAKDASDELDKELKVPPLPGEEPTATGAAAKEGGSTHTSASSKK